MGISSGKGPRVAVLMGGHSLEREVSLVSGQACSSALRCKDFQVLELDAGRDVVHGRAVKNTEALSNPEALEQFKDRPELAT